MPITEYPETLGVGPQGERGLTGGVSFDYRFDTGTGTGPADGELRLNHATPGSATALYINDIDANNVNLDSFLDTLAAGDLIVVRSARNLSVYHIYRIIVNADDGSYHNLTLTYIAGSGTFEDGETIVFTLSKRGPSGGAAFDYTFDTGTGSGPGSGEIRYDNANPALAANIYIHDSEKNTVSIDALLDLLAVGDIVVIKSATNPAAFTVHSILTNTDSGTYHTLGVSFIAGGGTFADNETLIFSISRRGPSGAFPLADTTYKTDGSFDTGSTSFVDVTGASVTWTQVTAGFAKIEVVGCFGALSGGSAHDAVMAIQVDGGSDFPLTGTEEHTDGSGNDTKLKTCSGGIVFSAISAGSHTVKIRLRSRGIGLGNAQICAETDMPLRLTVFHS